MPKATAKPRYQPHPLLEMEARWKEKVREATGKTWAQWVSAARRRKGEDAKATAAWLQGQGVPPMAASWVVHEAREPGAAAAYADPEPLVDALYAGEHAALRPLHERVVDAALALGDDVVATACKTMVPLYRKHVFADLRPCAGTVELQLALGDVAATGRLERSRGGMPGDRLTHVVRLRRAGDLDAEVRGWLAEAYRNGAGRMARSTEVAVPASLAKALRADPKASATWASMTAAMRRDMVQWVTSAKQDDTRARRQATALGKLSAGHKRVY